MRYDDNVIDEIMSRNDIIDIIGERVSLSRKGANYMGLCPFHGEKTASFSVSPSKQIFKCFGCGKGGNVITFIRDYENMTYPEAVEYLAGRAGIELPQKAESSAEAEKHRERDALLDINREAALFYYKLLRTETGRQGLEYFRKRGLSDDVIKHYGLGYSDASGSSLYRFLKSKGYSDRMLAKSGLISIDEKNGAHDKFWNRVMYPIIDQRGKVLGFGGRVMGTGEPKYLNSPETLVFEKSRTLFGIADAKKSRKNWFLICEGYMDVIALWAAGFENAVAALGTSFTPLHARTIKNSGIDNVVLTFDSDKAGRMAALRAIPLLKAAGITCRVLDMSPYKDPDEFIKNLGREEYDKRILDAIPSFDFELLQMEAKYDLTQPAEKTKFVEELAIRLAKFDKQIELANYQEYVAKRYGLGMPALTEEIDNIGRKKKRQEDAVEAAEETRAEIRRTRNTDSALLKSEKLLIAWSANSREILKAVKRYLSPEDFTGINSRIASVLFEKSGDEKISSALLLNSFDDSEQNEVADVLNFEIVGEEDESVREKIFSDTVKKLLENGLQKREEAAKAAEDYSLYMQISREKNELKKKIITIKA
jgi:DNA primase